MDTDALFEPPIRVLFVCTANIARSPYAERRARQLADGAAMSVGSAGVPGVAGRAMDEEMAEQLHARGAPSDDHLSRALSVDLLEETDLVLTFEFAHRLRIAQAWPDHLPKVFALRQLADAISAVTRPAQGRALLDQAYAVARADGMHWDVTDPHRRGRAAARECAAEIDGALSIIIPALAGTATDGAATGV